MGIRLLARAIEEPLRQIVENAGEDAAVVLNAVKAGKGAYGSETPRLLPSWEVTDSLRALLAPLAGLG